MKRSTARTPAVVVAAALVLAGCTPGGDTQPTATTSSSTTSTTSPATTTPGAETADTAEVVAFTESFMDAYLDYLSGVPEGRLDDEALQRLVDLYDPAAVTLDLEAAEACFHRLVDEVDGGLFEHGMWADSIETAGALWKVSVVDNQVSPGLFDRGPIRALVLGDGGLLGDAVIDEDAPPSCLETAASRTPEAEQLFRAALEAGVAVHVEDLPVRAAVVADDTAAGDPEWTKRPEFAADPSDPEPIRSTGSNTWDIIRTTDPSTFSCLTYLGQGPEQILEPDKSEYEQVDDAHLFVARFTDGTSIDIRVHPEIGNEQDATAEARRYLVPLGQLPTSLRQDIGRFAVRLGDNTATASPGEGISMQSGNADVRIAANRLEETLFHEAVHTSLDHTYAYQRSQEWMDAQAADGRWLTEYGRENPDSEDLAETALYAYGLLHHPGRIPAEDERIIRDRVPNRIAFLTTLFPPDEPIFRTVGPNGTCPDQ